MRCHDARELLLRRLDTDLAQITQTTQTTQATQAVQTAQTAPATDRTEPIDSSDAALEEHLEQCSDCRAFEQSQHTVEALLGATSSPEKSVLSSTSPGFATRSVSPASLPVLPVTMSRAAGIPTSAIMMAVQRQRQISQQLEHIQHQQQDRVARMRTGGIALAILGFLALGSVPLLLVVILLLQTDLMVNILSLLRSIIDVGYVLALSLQTALIVVTLNYLLLSLLAFAVVLMTGMWIRLMRPKRL